MSEGGMRLNKMLSAAGLASRRRADELIKEGRVNVNGRVVRTLGQRVDPEHDKVKLDGRRVRIADVPATIVLNKPDGVITTMSDPQGRRTVRKVVSEEPERFFAVGRLDFHTEGVLLMTTDGELANRLLHPRYKVPKVYMVKMGGRPRREVLDKLREGIELEDGMTQPALVDVIEEGARRTWVQLVITEGKKRQVRRMCEAIGHRPLRVIRTSFATLELEDLRPGQYRYLNSTELDAIYGIAQMDSPGLSPSAEARGPRALGRAERRKGALPGEERRSRSSGGPRSSGRGAPPRGRVARSDDHPGRRSSGDDRDRTRRGKSEDDRGRGGWSDDRPGRRKSADDGDRPSRRKSGDDRGRGGRSDDRPGRRNNDDDRGRGRRSDDRSGRKKDDRRGRSDERKRSDDDRRGGKKDDRRGRSDERKRSDDDRRGGKSTSGSGRSRHEDRKLGKRKDERRGGPSKSGGGKAASRSGAAPKSKGSGSAKGGKPKKKAVHPKAYRSKSKSE